MPSQKCYGNKAKGRVSERAGAGRHAVVGMSLFLGENVGGCGNRRCTCPEAGMCEGARAVEKAVRRARVVGDERQS